MQHRDATLEAKGVEASALPPRHVLLCFFAFLFSCKNERRRLSSAPKQAVPLVSFPLCVRRSQTGLSFGGVWSFGSSFWPSSQCHSVCRRGPCARENYRCGPAPVTRVAPPMSSCWLHWTVPACGNCLLSVGRIGILRCSRGKQCGRLLRIVCWQRGMSRVHV